MFLLQILFTLFALEITMCSQMTRYSKGSPYK